jgi:hypothetical protein
MIRIEFTYSEIDNAWVSEKITLDGDIVMKVQLTTKGKIVIKKQNGEGAPAPKVFISEDDDTELRITLRGHGEEKIIQVFASEEPSYMGYAKI